ncbi:hypothetical protein D3C71_2024780 [compost metagenome]
MDGAPPHLFGEIEYEMQREAGRGARQRQAGKPQAFLIGMAGRFGAAKIEAGFAEQETGGRPSCR